MKRIFLILLGIIVVLGLFGAAGYAGYRLGYAQGSQTTINGDARRSDRALRPFDEFHRRAMPGFDRDRRFERGFGPGRFPMMGFGFFSPLRWLMPMAALALLGLFFYWLFTRSGWRLTRQTSENNPPTQTAPPAPPPENE
jgi:cell division septal protein FtsQ